MLAVRRKGALEPLAAFAEVAADEPEAPEAVAESHRRLGFPVVEAPAERGSQVGVVGCETRNPEFLRWAGLPLSLLGETDVVPSVSGTHQVGFSACLQLRERELPDGREHLESRTAVVHLRSLHEPVVDERDEPVEYVG